MDCASDSPDSGVDESGSMNGKVPTSREEGEADVHKTTSLA